MPSTINCFIPCSQAPWKHGAHQKSRKACSPKSMWSCLSHLLGRKYTENLAGTRCSPACQVSMTDLNFHSMQSGQNGRKSRKNPSYLWQRLGLEQATFLGFGKPSSPRWMGLTVDGTGQGSGMYSMRLREQLYQELFHTRHSLLHLLIPTPHHALQRWPLCLPSLPLLSRCAFYAADVAAYLVLDTGSENRF